MLLHLQVQNVVAYMYMHDANKVVTHIHGWGEEAVNRNMSKTVLFRAPVLISQEGTGIVRKEGGHSDP